ncbi:BMP family lipoprotein [Aerococcus kribbianus]|uniref:BMP family ABC transporter substrate-binding protein n=1 Tax=Aerococcus kribbianus TaxID=2999064 RepID=A0A9X3FRI3_9LACT|nr:MULTISPECIES: BMP family ABC transporter substrate-binding protein [unclassified Aerococcus]MCZ0717002.1 BMP family ABC transporter substrate-binding protein [Aerococcus sp. YH-aer221]MCZ0725290.1 BMP family ABC transporter substrate-binding protein [Aerococcus sp. YH-aer222]
MKKSKVFSFGLLTLSSAVLLAACGDSGNGGSSDGGSSDQGQTKVAFLTDQGGIDDRSFNQSGWEGLVAWGEENGLSQGESYEVFQGKSDADYIPNIDQAINNGYNVVAGVGFKLKPAIEESASLNQDTNFIIVDEVIEGQDNVASATFRDQESAYLAGVAAAHTTQTDKVGFIGGVRGAVIDEFEAGFKAGVEAGAEELGKDIEVVVQYADAFDAPDKGRSIAQGMYGQDADIIYAAAGGTGNGLFQEAKAINEAGDKQVWVIGVDRDQEAEGAYTDADGNEGNFTLTSTTKNVGESIVDLVEAADNGEFPGGEVVEFGLANEGVGLTEGQLSDDAKDAVNKAKEAITNGDIEVPTSPEN